MSVTAYRDMGYLPQAVLNYLVRLGWSFGDQEFFTIEELITKFNITNLGRSAGVFNPEKLTALNADHIKAMPPEKLAQYLIPFLKQKGYPAEEGEYLNGIIATLNTRSKTLIEMADSALFYYVDQLEYDEKAVKKFLKPDILEPLVMLTEKLADAKDLIQETQETIFKEVLETTGIKFGKIAQPVRVALTGKTASPGIFEMIEILGWDRVISRLKHAIKLISGQQSK
jgi:glutamyl-tRNA synthetase